MSEKKGKRTLKGNTFLQLKEGVCFIGDIHFTHTSEHNKKGWYKLGAGIVDAALMHGVEVARTKAFLMKDGRAIYSEKHLHPRLSDKVSHLQQIGNKGARYERLEKENVKTVRDMLILLYTDKKRLENILKLKAASKIWDDIVNNAQASNGMFLYLDQSNVPKAGVVLNAKLELKAFIEESHRYIPVNQLSDEQKASLPVPNSICPSPEIPFLALSEPKPSDPFLPNWKLFLLSLENLPFFITIARQLKLLKVGSKRSNRLTRLVINSCSGWRCVNKLTRQPV